MRERLHSIEAAWSRFWFMPSDPTTLAAVRICTGLVLLYSYSAIAWDALSFVGPNAWVDEAVIAEIRSPEGPAGPWWGWSFYFISSSTWATGLIYVAFLASIVAFTVGFCTRIATVLVWAGHLSFVHGSFLAWSGMDSVLAMLTIYLMLGPSGDALSIDAKLRTGPPAWSWSANLALRLIQMHLAVIYLCAGLSKLQGARWWDGTAVWHVMMMSEFAPFDLSWLGRLGDTVCLIISNVGVLLTLAFEIGFIFLIWNPTIRPFLLAAAVLLHGGIGLFMGMSAFGAAMLAGCAAFLRPSEVDRFFEVCARLRSRAQPGKISQAEPLPTKKAA